MQVKVCPKCGVENAPNYPVCRRCQSSLAQVMATESNQTAQQPVATGAPTGQPYQQPQGPSMLPGQAPSRYGPKPPSERWQSEPEPVPVVKDSSYNITTAFWIIVLIALIGGGGFYYVKKNKPKPRPKVTADQVVLNFLKDKTSGQKSVVNRNLSQASVTMVQTALSGRQAASAGFTRNDSYDMLIFNVEPTKDHLKDAPVKAVVVEDNLDKDGTARVRATVTVKSFLGVQDMDFDFILVVEDQQWKIDLQKTNRAAL